MDRPTNATLRPCLRGRVQDLLDPVHVAGEAGDDDALLGGGEDLVEHGRDLPLADHDAGHFRVGGVRHQQVDAVGTEPGEAADVGQPAVQRELVHLEVAGVQNEAGRGADGDRERVGDRVVHREELEVEGADLLPCALGDLIRRPGSGGAR